MNYIHDRSVHRHWLHVCENISLIRFLKLFLIIVYHKGSLKYSRISEFLIYWQRRVQTFKRTGSTFEINQEQNPKYNFTLLLKKKVSKVLVCVMFYMKGHVYEKIFFSLGLSRICFFLPDIRPDNPALLDIQPKPYHD